MSALVFENALRGSRAYSQICNDLRSGLSHAYIIVSGDDDALDEFFTLIAMSVYCQNDACETCAECRKVLHNNHADIVHINEKRDKIKVETVTEMLSSVFVKPLSGRKLYFIHRADLMNAQAQNKLLKTFEEPPAGVTVFLGVANEAATLDTIKSRARIIHLDSFDENVIYSAMLALGCDEEMSAVAAACSEGMLGKARKIATSPEYAELYREAIKLMNGLQKSSDVVKFDGEIAARENVGAFLDVLSIIIRDMLVTQDEPDMILSKHVAREIATLANGYSKKALSAILMKINDTRRQISLNVGALSAIDDLLFSILEVRHKCPKL